MEAHDPYQAAKVVLFFYNDTLQYNNYTHSNLRKHNRHQGSPLLFSSLSFFE